MEFKELISKCPEEIKDLLDKSKFIPQTPKWHPEGANDYVPHNVYKHTLIVYNRAKKTGDINLMLSALFHDLGKVETTIPSEKVAGNYSSHGHEYVSAKIVKKYKEFIQQMGGDYDIVYQIVNQHMRINLIDQMRKTKQEELRKNKYYDKLFQFSTFDNMLNLSEEEKNL